MATISWAAKGRIVSTAVPISTSPSYADASSGVLVDLLNMARNTGEAAGDVYISIEGLTGSAHSDQFYGTAGWDGFYGSGGDDQLEGRGGGDQLDGGEGFDFAVYWSAASSVVASLATGTGSAGDAAGDVFVSTSRACRARATTTC